MANYTPLDREDWSFQLCDLCQKRKSQLTMDHKHMNRSHGEYQSLCWQCYWEGNNYMFGPIVNCGPMWDDIDMRRGLPVNRDKSSPS